MTNKRMKRIINTALIILLFSNWILAQENNCTRKTTFGETEICLPQIIGYQECYTHPLVRQLADETEVPSNKVLGFYLNNQTYEKVDSLGFYYIDDYIKIYGTKQLKGIKADTKLLQKMQDVLGGNFVSRNWELIEKEIDQINLEAKIGVPTIIKTYKLNNNSFTCAMLTTYDFEGSEPYTLAMTINGIVINERFIWMAYYLNYNGEETISRLQEKTNKILTKILSTEN